MKLIHGVFGDWKKEDVKFFGNLGITIKEAECWIKIEEDLYQQIKEQLGPKIILESIGAEFTQDEMDKADFLAFRGVPNYGYPEPSDDGSFRALTYDTTNYCKKCGIGQIQKAPFRQNKKPILKRMKMFQLHWTFSDLFVEKEFYEKIFRPIGMDSREVIYHKTEKVIDNVVQLILPQIKEEMDLKHIPFEICNECGRKKYSPKTYGFYKKYNTKELPPLFNGKEEFGSGAQSFKLIIISQEIRRVLLEHKQIKRFHCIPLH